MDNELKRKIWDAFDSYLKKGYSVTYAIDDIKREYNLTDAELLPIYNEYRAGLINPPEYPCLKS